MLSLLRVLGMVCLLTLSINAFSTQSVLIFGDSLSAGYGIKSNQSWPQLLAKRLQSEATGYQLINESISGETTNGGLERLPQALAVHRPAIVFIELGANDGLRGLPISSIESNLEAMIEMAQGAGAKVLLAAMQLPPNYGPQYTNQFHQLFYQLGKEQSVSVLPFFLESFATQPEYFLADGIHPNEKAQPLIEKKVWMGLRKLLD